MLFLYNRRKEAIVSAKTAGFEWILNFYSGYNNVLPITGQVFTSIRVGRCHGTLMLGDQVVLTESDIPFGRGEIVFRKHAKLGDLCTHDFEFQLNGTNSVEGTAAALTRIYGVAVDRETEGTVLRVKML